jgi:hypothetical protein
MNKKNLLFSAVLSFLTPGLYAQQKALQQLGANAQAPLPAAVPAPAPLPGGTLTIYAYPPHRLIDWSTPKKALKDFAATTLGQALAESPKVDFTSDFGEQGSIPRSYESTMGHTITHVNCVLPDGTAYNAWTSFSGQDFHQVDKGNLLEKKLGLGVLFQDYIDGHIISGVENQLRLIYYKGQDGHAPRYWQQQIDGQACGRVRDMAEFFKSFHFPKNSTLEQLEARPGPRTLYFTSNIDPYVSYMARKQDPGAKVGGGCAPYGLGLLKAAQKYNFNLDPLLTLKFDVSERLIGGMPDANGQIRKVSVSDLLGSLGDSWTYAGYNNRPFKNYDPYLIWKFIGDVNACLGGSTGTCTSETSAWLADKQGQVASGPVQQMSDTRQWETQSSNYDSGPSYETVTKTVKIAGIIVN